MHVGPVGSRSSIWSAWRRRRLVIQADATPAVRSPPRFSCSSANELYAEGRYADALDAYQRALNAAATRRRAPAARGHRSVSALRVAEFDLARTQAEALHQGVAARRRCAGALRRRAVGVGALRGGRGAVRRGARARIRSSHAATTACARSLAARSQLTEAMDEAQAALRLAPRDLEIHHTIGAIYERMHQYEEAAGAFSNYVNLLPNKDRSEKADWSRVGDQVPAVVRPARAVRDGSGRREPALHRRLPPGEREGHRPGEGQRRVVPGLRRRHRRREHGPVAARRRSGSASRRSPTRSAPASATSACAACSWRGSTRSSSARSSCATCPCMIKDPPLREPAGRRKSESLSPLALGFSMIIDYKTRKITFGKQLPSRTERLRAAAAAAPAGDGARHGRRHAAGELRRRHGRRGDLDQPGDRVEPRPAGADAPDCAEGVRIVGLGQGRVPDAGRRPVVRRHPATRTSRSWC